MSVINNRMIKYRVIKCLYTKQGQLRGKTFFTDHHDFGFEWGNFLAAAK